MTFGQIEQGDRLSIIDSQGRLRKCTARLVLSAGTDKEEIVTNKAKNHYFIVSMVLDGSSWAKAVAYSAKATRAEQVKV